MRLRRARLVDDRLVDVRLDGDRIGAIEPAATGPSGSGDLDLDGALLLPAPAEPHAHLDKALTADRVENRTGDLAGAIEAWLAILPTLTVEDMAARGTEAAGRLLANGCTAIRTHVNVGDVLGTKAVEAMALVRTNLAGRCDLQVVAMPAVPLTGRAGAGNRAALIDALDAGADAVGGCPHLDPDPSGVVEGMLELAGERGLPLDLHADETLDPGTLSLALLCDLVERTGFANGATASHCVSLGMQDEPTQRKVAEACVSSGVAVVTLPATNLFLQGRAHRVGTPRGLTALRPLLEAGATLAAGADNLQDPFNTVGRADPLETAALLVMAGHLLPSEAYSAVTAGARGAMGLDAPALVPVVGQPAELLAVAAPTLRAAVADAPARRWVIHRGEAVVTPVEQ
jgi:cytosine deaminase